LISKLAFSINASYRNSASFSEVKNKSSYMEWVSSYKICCFSLPVSVSESQILFLWQPQHLPNWGILLGFPCKESYWLALSFLSAKTVGRSLFLKRGVQCWATTKKWAVTIIL
jgi:hypothetical protein